MKGFMSSLGLFLFLLLSYSCSHSRLQEQLPNIVIIYMDDLGYGDVSAYGATEISTPNIAKLANNGLRFTKGYSSSATCSPSRYALLTGEYPWRKNVQILQGTSSLLIDTAQITIPKIL